MSDISIRLYIAIFTPAILSQALTFNYNTKSFSMQNLNAIMIKCTVLGCYYEDPRQHRLTCGEGWQEGFKSQENRHHFEAIDMQALLKSWSRSKMLVYPHTEFSNPSWRHLWRLLYYGAALHKAMYSRSKQAGGCHWGVEEGGPVCVLNLHAV